MLEIIVVIVLCKSIGRILRDKGRNPLLLQILLVAMWIGGEIVGAVAAVIVYAMQHGAPPDELELSTYLAAIVGAACGAGIVFLIAHLMPPVESVEEEIDFETA